MDPINHGKSSKWERRDRRIASFYLVLYLKELVEVGRKYLQGGTEGGREGRS